MKSKILFYVKLLLLVVLYIGYSTICKAQTVYNANFGNIDFTAAKKTHKVGTDGDTAGNVTLYTNVKTIGGQAIDCIIRTVSVTNTSFTLPGSPASGTIPFDYSSASGASMSANQDRYFSPTFNFTSAGSCKFSFEFILGGSYNNTSTKGTPVILENVKLNTYDIDGNDGANTNQFNEFGGFSTVTLGNPTNISSTYNSSTGLTKFRSNISTNSSIVTADPNRVLVQYNQVSKLDIIVGADGAGKAFFIFDFGSGANWIGTTVTNNTPILDLNTTSTGVNNVSTLCGGVKSITNGSGNTNLTQSSNSINEIIITFSTASILDGNAEVLVPKGSTNPSGDSIRLGFSSNSSQNITLNGVLLNVQVSVVSGTSTISIAKSSGTLTTAQTEMILDSLVYKNTSNSGNSKDRNISFSVREGSLFSPEAIFITTEICLLGIKWLEFEVVAVNSELTKLSWKVDNESNDIGYYVESSTDMNFWKSIGYVSAYHDTTKVIGYKFTIQGNNTKVTYFRIKVIENNNQLEYSMIKKIKPTAADEINIWPNPFDDIINIYSNQKEFDQLCVIDLNGRIIKQINLSKGLARIDLTHLKKGIYFAMLKSIDGRFKSTKIFKN